jgi:hypothetical protein
VKSSSRRRRLQTIPITIPNPTVANTPVSASVQLDKGYNTIKGFQFVQVQDGGISGNYNVGVRNSRRTLVDSVNYNAWAATSSVGPEDKFIEMNESYAAGDSIEVVVTPNVNTAAAMSGQLVIIVEDSNVELPM